MGAMRVRSKAAFIKVHDIFTTVLLHPLAQGSQVIYSVTGMTLRVPRRFF